MGEMMFKFKEDELLKEYEAYVRSTYTQHYSDEDGLQTIEKIRPSWREGFIAGNIQKYIDRPSKGQWRRDLFKVIHYAFLLVYWLDQKEAKLNEHKIATMSDLRNGVYE
jgi:hypothetical protein